MTASGQFLPSCRIAGTEGLPPTAETLAGSTRFGSLPSNSFRGREQWATGKMGQLRKFRLKTARRISKQSNFGWDQNQRFGSKAMWPLLCVGRFSFLRKPSGRLRVVQNKGFAA